MKKKYTRKQITEAIAYWKKQLNEGNFKRLNESYDELIQKIKALPNGSKIAFEIVTYDDEWLPCSLSYNNKTQSYWVYVDDQILDSTFREGKLTVLSMFQRAKNGFLEDGYEDDMLEPFNLYGPSEMHDGAYVLQFKHSSAINE